MNSHSPALLRPCDRECSTQRGVLESLPGHRGPQQSFATSLSASRTDSTHTIIPASHYFALFITYPRPASTGLLPFAAGRPSLTLLCPRDGGAAQAVAAEGEEGDLEGGKNGEGGVEPVAASEEKGLRGLRFDGNLREKNAGEGGGGQRAVRCFDNLGRNGGIRVVRRAAEDGGEAASGIDMAGQAGIGAAQERGTGLDGAQ